MKTVSPGDPLLPNLTAQWYNQTLPKAPTNNAHPRKEGFGHPYGRNTAGVQLNKYQPVGVVGFAGEPPNLRLTYPSYLNWSVTQQAIPANKTGQVVTSGLTLAYVNNFVEGWSFVHFDGTQLITAPFGKAELVVYNPSGPSLINLGHRFLGAGTAWTTGIPSRSGSLLGSASCVVSHVVNGRMYDSPYSVTLYNDRPDPLIQGYVQFKAWNNLLVVDVASCDIELEPIGAISAGLRNWWPFRGWT